MLESALASTPMGIGYADRDLRFVRVNDALARFTGHPAEAHVGRRVRDVLPHPAGALAEPLLRRVLDTGEPALGLEVQLPTPGHVETLRHFIVNLYPVRGPRGETRWVGASITDVTALRRTQQDRERLLAALRESEARFRALSESGVIGVLVADPERILEANDAFLDLLGYTRAEMLAGHIRWSEITPISARWPGTTGRATASRTTSPARPRRATPSTSTTRRNRMPGRTQSLTTR